MLWTKRRKAARRNEELAAYIDEGSEIEGRYTFTGTAVINGKFKGEISSSDTLIIGEKGVVNAVIRAAIVRISGEVMGGVQATERVEMKPSARVFADIEAPVVIIEEGVVFDGNCRMAKTGTPLEEAAPAGRDQAASVVSLLR